MMQPVLRGLLRWRWASPMTPAAAEVRWYQKRVDLAFVSIRVGAVAIELKVDDWSRAIEQARLNRLLTSQSWVALWHASSTRAVRSASHAGVGLLIVTDRGVYPALYPRVGGADGELLKRDVRVAGTRVRDLLSLTRHRQRPAELRAVGHDGW